MSHSFSFHFPLINHLIYEWIKHEANQHRDGVGFTPLESIADAVSAEADWDKHKAQHGIKTAICPPRGKHCDAKIRERFIFKKYPHRWATGVELRNTLECHKLAKKHGMDHIINDFLEHDVGVTSANLNNAICKSVR